MQIRRCAVLYIEPREDLQVDWAALFAGEGALGAATQWVALAPHMDSEIGVDAAQLNALGAISAALWSERAGADARFGADVVSNLLDKGLLLADDEGCAGSPQWRQARARDETLRGQHWRPVALLFHTYCRWGGMAVETGMQFPTFEKLVAQHGAPPRPTIEYCRPDQALPLPPPERARLDDVFFKRYTGRNYDANAVLPLASAARLLQRAFGAQFEREMAPDATVLKKISPSAGGLHPIEAFVMAQRVEGVPSGLYHYHPVRHALEPMQAMDTTQTADLAMRAVADQDWFVGAPMLVFLVARVERNFWKYRNHVKAYRAILLDAGHLSQTFYLLATEAGMPAFVTAAMNEKDVEQAFGLDPLTDAVIAVCGCGPASGAQDVVELR